MSDVNSFSCTGRVGKQPEIRYTGAGMAVLDLTIAVGGSKKVNGQWEKTTQWLRTTCFEKRAESLVKMINKGDRIGVSGTLEIREYDRKEGGKGTSVEIANSEIVLLSDRRDGGQRQPETAPTEDHGPLPF